MNRFFYCTAMIVSLINASFSAEEGIKEYGIVVLPSAEIAVKAAEMNTEFATKLGNNPGNFWHVTLYHLACSEASLTKIVDELSKLEIEPFQLEFKNIYSTADRWIDWGMKNTDPLHELHRKVIEIASSHRMRPLDRARDIYEDLSPDRKAQVDAYGVSGVLEFYNPHMTLFYRYPPDATLQGVAAEFARDNGDAEMNGNASSIAVVELGYNGNIEKIVRCINIAGR